MAALWPRLPADPVEARKALEVLLPALVDKYGGIAETVAAEWYERLTGERAVLGATAARAELGKAVGWAASTMTEEEFQIAYRATMKQIDKFVKNQARETVAESCRSNLRRFARMTTGVNTCAFCDMMAANGYVYESRDSAGEGKKYHGNCHCIIVPEDGVTPAGFDPAGARARYEEAKDVAGTTDINEVAKALRELYPERYGDGYVNAD